MTIIDKRFRLEIAPSGKKIYVHIENDEKRVKILKDFVSGEISNEDFLIEQKKMRGGRYLKSLFNENAYYKFINKN